VRRRVCLTRHSRHHAPGRSSSASRTVVVDTIGGYRPYSRVLLDLGPAHLGPNVPVYSADRNFCKFRPWLRASAEPIRTFPACCASAPSGAASIAARPATNARRFIYSIAESECMSSDERSSAWFGRRWPRRSWPSWRTRGLRYRWRRRGFATRPTLNILSRTSPLHSSLPRGAASTAPTPVTKARRFKLTAGDRSARPTIGQGRQRAQKPRHRYTPKPSAYGTNRHM